MANEIKLEVYTIAIREKRGKVALLLSDVLGDDFLSFVKGYIESFNEFSLIEESKRSIQYVASSVKFNSGDRTISGIIESGDYGFSSKLVNWKTKKQTGKKSQDDLDIKPFYFLLWLPKDKNKGVVILQRIGIHGINGIFIKDFRKYFNDKFGNLIIDFSPVITKSLAKKFVEEGAIKTIILRRYDLPANLEDKFGLSNHRGVASLEIRVVAKSRRFLPFNERIKKFINNKNAELFDLPGLSGLGIDGNHESSAVIKLGNSLRTIDLSETGEIRPYFDVTEDVEIQTDGHPKFDSIDEVAKKLLNDLHKDMGYEPTKQN